MANQDRISEVYKGEVGSPDAQRRARHRVDWLCSQARGRVLDIGCSQGVVPLLLARKGVAVLGVDVEFDRLKYAESELRAEGNDVASCAAFLLTDGARLPFPDGLFDTILLGEVLEHVDDPDAVLAEVARALSEEGRVAITVPFGYHPHHDHKRSFYASSVLRMVSGALTPLRIDLVEQYLRILARPGIDQEGAWRRLTLEAQPAFEAMCLEVEQERTRLHDELTRVRRQRDEAHAELATCREEPPHSAEAQSDPAALTQESQEPENGWDRLTHATRWRVRRVQRVVRTIGDDPGRALLLLRNRATLSGSRKELNRGLGAKRRGEWKDAEHSFLVGVRETPGEPILWFYLAQVQRKLGKTHEACASALRATGLRPRWRGATLLALDLLIESEQPEEVAILLRNARLPRKFSTASIQRACDLLIRAEQYEPARSLASEFHRLRPQNDNAVVMLSICDYELGRPDDARGRIRQYLQNGQPGLPEAFVRFFLHIGDVAGARKIIDAVKSPNPTTLLRVGRELVRSGGLSEGLAVLERAAQISPNDHRIQVWREKAESELKILQEGWEPRTATGGMAGPVKNRILHLVGRSLPHTQVGYTLRTQEIAKSQQRIGLDPHVVTRFGFGGSSQVFNSHEVIDSIPHHRIPGDPATVQRLDERLDRSYERLSGLVSALRPSVLHAHSDYRNAVLALELGRSFDLPVVYEVRGFWEESWLSHEQREAEGNQRYSLSRDMETCCMRQADCVVTLSESMKAAIAERGIPEREIWVVPNAVDTETFKPRRRDQELAGTLGLSAGESVLGCVSTLVAYEGICYLIDAIAELRRRGRSVRAVVVGDGPERERLEHRARAQGVGTAVVFTGRVLREDVHRYYGILDIFVVPRTNERVCHLVTPLKPYEALASGRPVVVSSVKPLREVVGELGEELVFEVEDPISLADTVEPLLDDGIWRERLGAEARRWACRYGTWQRSAERYRALYEELGGVGGDH